MSNIDDDIAEDFRDIDPEDEWDDNDAFRDRLAILDRILDELRERRDDRFRVRVGIALGLVAGMIREHREDSERLDRIQARLDEIKDDD